MKHLSDTKTDLKKPLYIIMVITCFRPYLILLFRQKSNHVSAVGSCKWQEKKPPHTKKSPFIASSCDFTEPIYYLVPCYAAQHNQNEYCYFWKWRKFTVNGSILWVESCCPLLPYISLILGVLQKYRNRCNWTLQFYLCLYTSWSDWLSYWYTSRLRRIQDWYLYVTGNIKCFNAWSKEEK